MHQTTSTIRQSLTPKLKQIALKALDAYLHAPSGSDGRTPIEMEADVDAQRVKVIEGTLKPLLAGFLNGSVPLVSFKRQVDSVNRQNRLWGFSGIKGQMFFNVLTNLAADKDECDTQLKTVLRVPANDQEADKKLRDFCNYVIRVGDQFVEGGGARGARPMPGSIPSFVSYFWQIQDRDVWPVYYTNTVQMLTDMNLWQETEEVGDDYLSYKHLHEMLAETYSEAAGRRFSLYDVEHVFWFKSGKLTGMPPASEGVAKPGDHGTVDQGVSGSGLGTSQTGILADSYVPPIIAIIPELARNNPKFAEEAQRAGTNIDRALEKSCHAAFTILGYETRLLGQGMGRVPDGQAIALDESYAILWDAKVRLGGYKMGTDDRVIREYIATQSRELTRKRNIRNIYYLIISSKFTDDFDDLIRSLKMETDVNEVCLVEAPALVAMVDQKLRSPLDVTLGPDGIQQIFSASGIVTASDVLESLG
jgi:hypothetical protein